MDAKELQLYFDGNGELGWVPKYVCSGIRRGERESAWRGYVLIENDFVCCVTGVRMHPSCLVAHHLWETSGYPDGEWNVLNGRPMATRQHVKFHAEMSKRRLKATPRLLIDWMIREATGRTDLIGPYPGEWMHSSKGAISKAA